MCRLTFDESDTWYHCYNRVAGTSRDRPFREADREQFIRILKRVAAFYAVRVVAFQVMSNHYHLLVQAPEAKLDPEEVCRRYEVFHRGRKTLEPDSAMCRVWQERTRDISWFMRHLQQLFTAWFNRSRPLRRRGKLWADRFKHTILEPGPAVWACWKYIEANPVRAGMVEHAGDYRFGSYGIWKQTGRHPFAGHLASCAAPMLGLSRTEDVLALLSEGLGDAGTRATAGQRMRFWIDGLVVGSELFVRDVMAARHPRAAERRIGHPDTADPPLACWRRLRPVMP